MKFYTHSYIFSFDLDNIMRASVILLGMVYIIQYLVYFFKNVITKFTEVSKYMILSLSIISLKFLPMQNEIKYGVYFLIFISSLLILLSPVSYKNKKYRRILKSYNETNQLIENFKQKKGLIIK